MWEAAQSQEMARMFSQRQDGGTTEILSEAPGAYGIHRCSLAARIASYGTTSAQVTLLSPEVGKALQHSLRDPHTNALPLIQPLDGPCLSMGLSALRTSVSRLYCS